MTTPRRTGASILADLVPLGADALIVDFVRTSLATLAQQIRDLPDALYVTDFNYQVWNAVYRDDAADMVDPNAEGVA